jgi:hypothetical protein
MFSRVSFKTTEPFITAIVFKTFLLRLPIFIFRYVAVNLHKICLGVAFTTLMKQMKQNP